MAPFLLRYVTGGVGIVARVDIAAKPETLSVDLDRTALLIIDMQRD